VFGGNADEKASFEVLDTYLELGGNFIDSADVYSKGIPGHRGGESETVIGRWMKSRSVRDRVVVATKVGSAMGPGPQNKGLHRGHVERALKASLKRLQVDAIDIYYAHQDDPQTPLEETLAAVDAAVSSGRVRYAGVSFPGWRPIGFGFALGAVNFFAIVVPIQFAAQSIAPLWMKEQFDMSHLLENQTPWELAALIGGVGLAAPFCEEFVFRGVLQQGLMSSLSNARRAIAWTAVIFSAAHLDPVGFSARLELGVLFGILFWKTGSIWPGAMAHAANNLVSTGIYFAVKGARADVEDPL